MIFLISCSKPLAVSHISQDNKAITRRKGAPNHYFLSQVVCFDPLCRKFIGWKKKQKKKRFKGYKNKNIPQRFNKPNLNQQDSSAITQNPEDSYQLSSKYDNIEYNSPTSFQNANFETNAVELGLEFLKELDTFANYLSDHNEIKVRIIGHTDDVGLSIDNYQLSANRAKKVVEYLVSKGLSSGRFSYIGVGNSRPLVTGITEGARKLNRRVEFELIH